MEGPLNFSSGSLEFDVWAMGLYWVAVSALWVYDYVLTIESEVKFLWSSRKSFVFWLFIVNRYYPFGVVITTIFAQFYSPAPYGACRCDKAELLSPHEIAPRVYALLKCNKVVILFSSTLIAAQCAIAVYTLIQVLTHKGPEMPLVAASGIHACVLGFSFFSSTTPSLTAFLSLGLAFDFSAFVVLLTVSIRAIRGGFYLGKLLRVIQRDGTLYFFVVFSSNLMWLLLVLLEPWRPTLHFIHDYPALIVSAVMVNRITMNLREADGRHATWIETLSRLEFA
ncbi:hypothetical protein ONZ45_g2542 [Pleurotus djamor]|nr:hypothetical protein ONZ45_g2542 [Pleurotus djamor]